MNIKNVFFPFLLLSCHHRPLLSYSLAPATTPVPLSSNTDILKQIAHEVSSVAEYAKKGLVFVSVSKPVPQSEQMIDPFEFFFGPNPYHQPRGKKQPRETPKQEGLGSGFIIDLDKGYILTNNHVVEGADKIEVKLSNESRYLAKIVGNDPNTDVAVLEISDKSFSRKDLMTLVLGDSDLLTEGTFVLALGAPFGLASSVSFGIISALKRGSLSITDLGDFIQTDTAINPGNSGGPLVTMDGKVVGINTAIASKSGASNGIGFTVPANLVRKIATNLINDGVVERGFIGVGLRDLPEEWYETLKIPKGIGASLVADVSKNSPASQGGMEPNDVIITINEHAIKDTSDLRNKIGFMKPGEKAKLEVYRDGQKKSLSITIGAFPGSEKKNTHGNKDKDKDNDAASTNVFGFSLSTLNDSLRKKHELESNFGVLISGIKPDSPADQAGLEAGDLILAINGTKVTSAQEAQKLMDPKSKILLLRIERQGQFVFVAVKKQ